MTAEADPLSSRESKTTSKYTSPFAIIGRFCVKRRIEPGAGNCGTVNKIGGMLRNSVAAFMTEMIGLGEGSGSSCISSLQNISECAISCDPFESGHDGEGDIDLRRTYGRSNVHSKKAKREGKGDGKSDRNKR